MTSPNSEDSFGFAQYRDIVLRRRWWLLATLFLVWAAAWAMTWLLPAKYRSETTILIDELKVPERDGIPNMGSTLQARLQTLTPQILSRTRLRRIVQDLELYAGDRDRLSLDGLVDRMRRDIKVQPVQAAGRPAELAAFTVSYSGANPDLAQQVTTRLTSLFIEENVRTREQQAERTTDFLESELQIARSRLQQQEERLKQFKTQYLGQLPSQLQTNLYLLNGLDTRLQTANEALTRAEQQKMYLSSLLAQYGDLQAGGPTPPSAPKITAPALAAELSRLRAELATLRARYTDRHPEIVNLSDQIAKTEKLKAQVESDAAAGKAPDNTAADSPATAQIQSQLKANDLEISNRKAEIAGLEAESQNLQARLRSTPMREQQLAEVTRDYDQSRAYYESLLAKKNQSQLASNLEKRQQGEQFRVLDPPSRPTSPYFPNRFTFSLGGLALGLVAGGFAAYGRELADDRIHSSSQVLSLCPTPVLASIPQVPAAGGSLRRRLRIYVELTAVCALLAVVARNTFVAFITYYRS